MGQISVAPPASLRFLKFSTPEFSIDVRGVPDGSINFLAPESSDGLVYARAKFILFQTLVSGSEIVIDSAGTAQFSSDNGTTVGSGAVLRLLSGNEDVEISPGGHVGMTTFIRMVGLREFADNTAAAAGGVPVDGIYKTTAGGSSVLKIRT